MKKPSNLKKSPSKKTEKKDAGELRKPAKLKPLSEKEKKNWKNALDEDEDDFSMEEEDIKFDDFDNDHDDDDDDDGFYDDNF